MGGRASKTGGNMNEPGMSDEAMRVGLLMEAAQAQQRLGQECLQRLAAHTHDLDAVVRDEVRRTIAEELGNVAGETRRVMESLQRMRRAANMRTLLWTVSMATICSAVGMCEVWWALPSQREIEALRARRDALAVNIARIEKHGGLLDLRT